MNKQGKDKIDWTDYTWNPISGCYHNCSYCYMKRMEKRFKGIMNYAFHEKRLIEPTRKTNPYKIFTGSSGDMWGEWVEDDHISAVLDIVEKCPQHIFQFLTKNPDEYTHWDLSLFSNVWLGTTVDGSRFTEKNLEIMQQKIVAPVVFVSFEPLQLPVNPDLSGINWVIIGANSNKGAVKPPDKWADKIIHKARETGAAVWVKNNYNYHTAIKEFPANHTLNSDAKGGG